MVRIRMQRLGRRHRPFYRINAIDIRTRRNGKVLENLGHYNPMAPEGAQQVVLHTDKIKAWIEKGARPSETVMDMLGREGLLEGKMKAEWEAHRAEALERGKCRAAVKRAEAAVAAIEGNDDADVADLNAAKKALTMAKNTVAGAKVADADKFAGEAEAAAKRAEAAKPAPEPEAEPAAE
ncbi:MAG: 30S ribosomal protein S16 [Phycisphaerales bacterium]